MNKSVGKRPRKSRIKRSNLGKKTKGQSKRHSRNYDGTEPTEVSSLWVFKFHDFPVSDRTAFNDEYTYNGTSYTIFVPSVGDVKPTNTILSYLKASYINNPIISEEKIKKIIDDNTKKLELKDFPYSVIEKFES